MSVTTAEVRIHRSIWTGLTPLAAGLVILTGVFWPECRAAVVVWIDSTAYGHCFLVAPIAAYLAWDRRDTVRGMSPDPKPTLALLGLPLPLAWFAAERLGIMEGRQLVVIAFIELLVLTALGWRLFRAFMGPLLYLVFLVPFGAFLTPLLQSFTAHFIDVGLTLLAIPHFVSSMTIEISAGTFYVAEACAGLRFLIASIAFGVFFALLNYQDPRRRAGFIAASILIPIVANGFRALGIVVLGSILGSAEAAAADHILYGWVFFSIVMLLLVAAGLPFREPPRDGISTQTGFTARLRHPWATLGVVMLATLGPACALALDTRLNSARLNGRPGLVSLRACPLVLSEPGPSPTDRLTYTMTCSDQVWTLIMQAVPGGSTASALTEARRRLVGPMEQDEVIIAPLADTANWQTIISRDPSQITAIAAWIDGLPATGGFAQRIQQARNSIVGADHDTFVMAMTTHASRVFSEPDIRAALATVGRFVEAQPDLTLEIAKITARDSTGGESHTP